MLVWEYTAALEIETLALGLQKSRSHIALVPDKLSAGVCELGKGRCVREDGAGGQDAGEAGNDVPSLMAPSAPGLLFKFLFYSK